MMKGGLSWIFFFLKAKSVIVPWLEQGERTHETSNSFSQFEYVCASSPGGPGLNFGELNAGRSILGTIASNQVSLWSFLQRPSNPNTHTIMDNRLSRAISSKNKSHQKEKKVQKLQLTYKPLPRRLRIRFPNFSLHPAHHRGIPHPHERRTMCSRY